MNRQQQARKGASFWSGRWLCQKISRVLVFQFQFNDGFTSLTVMSWVALIKCFKTSLSRQSDT